jgi:hypothetical protein
MTAALNPYEGLAVTVATIRVTNAGDGLSAALKVEPTEYHHGDTVYVMLECEVARVAYEPIPDTNELRRVHTLRAGVGTVVADEAAAAAIERQRAVLERAAGIQRLDLDADAEAEA